GISVAGIILPQAIAYAGLANMPPMAGIVAACVGLLVYGLLGTSRFALVTGTSSSAVVLLAAIHSLMSTDAVHSGQLASALVIVTGVFFLICALFRLGRIAHFIARPVVRGMALGLSVTIVLQQFASLAGIHAVHNNVIPLLYELLGRIGEWNVTGLGLGAIALILLNLCKLWPRVPGPLLVMALGVYASLWFDLHAQHIEVVGDISLPDTSNWHLDVPLLGIDEWLRIAELAVALMLILFSESYSSIRTTALQHGDAINVNRDLLALGCANLLSGLLHALPVGAGYSATMANQTIGARSRLAGFSAAIYILIALWLLINYVALIPEPVLAAIVIYAMQHALSLEPLQPYLKWRRDRLMVMVSVVAVLTLGVLDGLLASIAFSLMMLIRGLSQPRISVLGRLRDTHDYIPLNSHADVHAVPQVVIIRPDEPLFFANVDDMFEKALDVLRQSGDVKTLILSLEESPNIDGTVIEALDQFSRRVRDAGCMLVLARLKPPVQAVLHRAQLQYLGDAVLNTSSVAAAVGALSF
ncbi:MAG: SulP family inorganic anion transporter, partial [Steroidobacter sp.]